MTFGGAGLAQGEHVFSVRPFVELAGSFLTFCAINRRFVSFVPSFDGSEGSGQP